ncbi:endoribonuclease L-PSP, putative [Rubidibacter lacunae KORDI 51-2]|uniref:Endoribonuclease L-PSP, putative n=1 Tax=Rubidibacter lacunae KORDI 51-2 TaxID=582515 RepID=U5DFZ8_9CHRO|nr:Rid family detoxifying hydrolase [Rubidibacter lacunae]ERN40521.1 endoribonuclease L-PSP, putative [Rubidibacter lacunae KORDI 51-2]
MNQAIQTHRAPAPVGPYNQAVSTDGQLVFVSGQIALDPTTSQLVGADDIVVQTQQVMANLAAVLAAAGTDWSNAVKTTIYLVDLNDFAAVNEIYSTYFDPAIAPARACVEVSRLPKDARIEIECIAAIA